MKKATHLLLIFVISIFALQINAQSIASKIELLDAYYAKAMHDWNVPGMAIALVTKDSILFAKGYGIADINTKQAVNEHTLFAVASNTKAFTALGLAMLVDEKKLTWDDKVIKHLPYFSLYDPYVSNNMTIRDLLSHRSGLKTFSGDLIWYGSTYSREEVIRKAKYLKPSYGFREQFGYSNIMFIAAGEIIPTITNTSWDSFVKEKILTPLGMHRSTLHVDELGTKSNVAQPHTYVDKKLKVIPWLDWDNMGPAGSLISSATEMGYWLQLNLGKGVFKNDTLVSAARIFEMQSAVTPIVVTSGSLRRFPSTYFKAYGLGWSLNDYLGKKVVSHNGGYDGMISQTAFLPDENIGFVILTNSLTNLYYPLMYKTLDVLLNNPIQKDWSTEILGLIEKNNENTKKEKEKIIASRAKNTKPSLKPIDYTGNFSCPIYDSVQIQEEKGVLTLRFTKTPDFIGVLSHWHYDTFEFEFKLQPSLPKGYVTFKLDRNGKVEGMEIFLDNPDFDFTELELKKLP